MAIADGKLLTLNLLLKAWGIPIHIRGHHRNPRRPSRPQAPKPTMTLRLSPLTAAVGRHPNNRGDWTYRLCTPTTWVL